MSIPSVKTQVKGIIKAVLWMNNVNNSAGWSESYNIGVSSLLTGSTGVTVDVTPPAVTDLLLYRRPLLGAGVVIKYGSYYFSGTTSTGLPFLTADTLGVAMSGESPHEPTNLSNDALQIRMQSLENHHSIRAMKACRDGYFSAGKIDASVVTNIGTNVTSATAYTATPTTAAHVVSNWLAYLCKNTFLASEVVAQKYNIEPWSFGVAIGSCSRKIGRPFRLPRARAN